MTKKILCLFLAVVMIFGALAVLGSCGGGGDETCEHVDANKDNKCDECGEKMGEDKDNGGEDGGGTSFNYPWKNETLIFQMNRNTDKSQIPFGGERYLAGEDKTADEDIDSDVADRNTEAYIETKVTVKYQYWPDTHTMTCSFTGPCGLPGLRPQLHSPDRGGQWATFPVPSPESRPSQSYFP